MFTGITDEFGGAPGLRDKEVKTMKLPGFSFKSEPIWILLFSVALPVFGALATLFIALALKFLR